MVGRALSAAAFAGMLLGATGASASQRTVTLAVDGMTCASCPYIVRTALLKLPGVERAVVSYADKTAVVTFDDTQAGIADLTAATAASGFPSRLLDQQQAKPR